VRLHRGKLVFLDEHLDRLFEGAGAIALDIGMTRAAITDALWTTLHANGMEDGVHLRLMVTRGIKRTPNQDPRNALGRPTVVIVAEWKQPSPALLTRGLRLATSSIRCSPADMFDMRLNSHSRLNLITALLQAIAAGGDEALMLDPHGFVSSCNATNFFWVRGGQVFTSSGQYCFNGITRAKVIALCRDNGIPVHPGNFALKDVYAAEEAFVTGTFGGLTPVSAVDGRSLPAALPGPVTSRLRDLYAALKDRAAA
jgi:branched-chain amino acid aminotransferase